MQKPLTNADVINMLRAGVPESAIIASIRTNPARFDVSLDKLLALHRQGVSTRILNAMAIKEMRRRKGLSGSGGTNADELSPQPYPPKGALMTPGAQQTLLGTQANSPSGDGSKSALVPAVQRPAITDGNVGDGSTRTGASGLPAGQAGALNGDGKTAVTANQAAVTAPAMMPKTSPGQIGTSQTMSAQGSASSSTAVTQSVRTVAPAPRAATASSAPRMTNLAAIERVSPQTISGVAAGCLRDPSRRILGVFDGSVAVKTFKIGHAYTIVGCSFGTQLPTGAVYMIGGGGGWFGGGIVLFFQIQSWNDNFIVFSTDPSETADLTQTMNYYHEPYAGPVPLTVYISQGQGASLSGCGISVN